MWPGDTLEGACYFTAGSRRSKEERLRVVQLADLHYAPSETADRGLDQAARLVERLDPDLVVVSGDLSRDGLVEQFIPVFHFLEGLGLERVRAIPGNRDYPATRPSAPRPADSDLHYFLAAPDTHQIEDEVPGVSMGWTPFTDFFPAVDVFERFPTLTLVALDSEPSIPDDALDRAIAFYEGSSPAVPRMFCTHRSLLPVPAKRLKEGDLLPNSGEILSRLIGAQVSFALCAHLHRASAWHVGDERGSVVVVNGPSLIDTTGGKLNGLIAIDIAAESVVTLHLLDGSEPRELVRTPVRSPGRLAVA